VRLATRVDHVVCAHGLEAGVRELRLLAAHAPPYNRRSKFPKRAWWIALSAEAFPRLTVVRDPAGPAVGPFHARAAAADIAATVAEYCGLRTCTAKLARTALHTCTPETVGGCPAAADTPRTATDYAPAPAAAHALFAGTDDAAIRHMLARIEKYATAEQ